ncbi:MAG: glycine oxidase ThiO [Betaproteobacteria bacterium]
MGDGPSDVVVVGAGVVGCAVAYELARRGASVQIVDERSVGMGATQASAGVLAPYIEAGENGPFLDLTVRGLRVFDDFIARVTADSGVPVAYHRTGTLAVVTDADRMTALRNLAARLEARGVSLGLLEGNAAHAEEPHLADDVTGALLVPVHGFVGAVDLTRALAAAARRHGAQVVEHSRVRRIAPQDSDVVVETERGSLTGNAVVLAAGSWCGRIAIEGVQPPPVRPVRGQLLHLGWNGSPLRRVVWGDRCYLVPWDDGTLLVGATVEDAGFDERVTAAGVRDLLEAACDLVPHAWAATFIGARVGLRPATSDGFPIIGPSGVVPNLMYATGHYRNGVLLAPLTAQLLADTMMEGQVVDPVLRATDPSRFGL